MICWTADYFRKQWEDLVESRKTSPLKDESLPRFLILSGLDEAMYYWWNSDKEKTQEVLQRQKTYADEVAGEDRQAYRAPKDGCRDSKKNEAHKFVDHNFVNFTRFLHFYLIALLLTPKDLFT